MTNNEFLIWLTGFWEGEGSIGTYTTKVKSVKKNKIIERPQTTMSVSIVQYKSPEIFRKINRFLLRQDISSYTSGNLFGLSSRNAEKFIQLIYPYLQLNKKINQIRKAFSKINRVRNNKKQKLLYRSYIFDTTHPDQSLVKQEEREHAEKTN